MRENVWDGCLIKMHNIDKLMLTWLRPHSDFQLRLAKYLGATKFLQLWATTDRHYAEWTKKCELKRNRNKCADFEKLSNAIFIMKKSEEYFLLLILKQLFFNRCETNIWICGPFDRSMTNALKNVWMCLYKVRNDCIVYIVITLCSLCSHSLVITRVFGRLYQCTMV